MTRPAPLVVFPPKLLSLPAAAETTTAKPLLTRIVQERVYSFYGPFSITTTTTTTTKTLPASAAACIAANSDGDAGRLAAVLGRFLDHARRDCIADAAPPDQPHIAQAGWLVVRMLKASGEYAVPRWHRDGRMFTCSCSSCSAAEEENEGGGGGGEGEKRRKRPHSKYAVTLLGPSTRVLVPSKAVDDAFLAAVTTTTSLVKRALDGDDDEMRKRAELAEALQGEEVEECRVRRGQVIRFSWGQADSPVHSEPDFGGEDRVFVSVLFGSEAEIRDMCRLRRETFGAVVVSE